MHKSTRHECIKQGISPIAEYSRSLLLSPFRFTDSLSLSLILSSLDETKPRDTFDPSMYPVSRAYRASASTPNLRVEPIPQPRETGFDNLSDDIRFARLIVPARVANLLREIVLSAACT